MNILKDDYEEAYKVLQNLDDNLIYYLNKSYSHLLFKVIFFIQFNRIDEALNICKEVSKQHNDINYNYIMYYYDLIMLNTNSYLKYLMKNIY